MYKIKACYLILIIILALALPITAEQNQPEQSGERVSSSDAQALDNGYIGTAIAISNDQEEALRLARTAASRAVFSFLNRDELFVSMFLTDWAQTIEVRDATVERVSDDQYQAEATVFIAQTAIHLTQQAYNVQVVTLLDQADNALAESAAIMQEAGTMEANLQIMDASVRYNQARRVLDRAIVMLKPLGTPTVISTNGHTIATIIQLISAASNEVDASLTRIQEMQEQAAMSETQRQLLESSSSLIRETQDIMDFVREKQSLSPFYDLPRQQLERHLSDIAAQQEKARLVGQRLEELQLSLGAGDVYIIQSIEISLTDLRQAEKNMAVFNEEIRLEIKEPRLQRQAKARQKEERKEAIQDAARWIVAHQQKGYASIRYDIPLILNPREDMQVLDQHNIRFELQNIFPPGIWLQTASLYEQFFYPYNGQTTGSSVFSQQVSGAGVLGPFLMGAGFSWDWASQFANGSKQNLTDGETVRRGILNFGYVSQRDPRPFLLTQVIFKLPDYQKPLSLYYLLDGTIRGQLILKPAITLDGAFRIGCLQTGPADPQNFFDAYTHLTAWRIGAGFHLPPPFTLGVEYHSETFRDLSPRGFLSTEELKRSGWRFYIAYTI